MSALNDFYENEKYKFSDSELDELDEEFFNLVSSKFPNCSSVEWDVDEIGEDLYIIAEAKINVKGYNFIVRGDDNGTPVLDIVHNSNIIGVYYPKNVDDFLLILDQIVIP